MFSPALVKKVCTYVYNIVLKTLIFNKAEKKKRKINKIKAKKRTLMQVHKLLMSV